MDDATRARLESIRDYADMSHGYRQAVGGILAAYDALRAERDQATHNLEICRDSYRACRDACAQAAPVLAACRVYADRWEHGTDPELGQARTTLLDAIANWEKLAE